MGFRTILSLKLVLPVLALVIGTGWLGGGVTWTPTEAEAAPPQAPTRFRVTGYNPATNVISFAWTDDQNYPANENCRYGNSQYNQYGWVISGPGGTQRVQPQKRPGP